MKNQKILTVLSLLIAILAFLCVMAAFFAPGPVLPQSEFTSIYARQIPLHGAGIYARDSENIAVQGLAQDFVTLVVGIPLLLMSLRAFRKGSFRGQLLLAGTTGYFLYTYMSYVFLWMLNPLFLVYVAVMALSLWSFVINLSDLSLMNLADRFLPELPRRWLGCFQIFLGSAVAFLWLAKVIPAAVTNSVPEGLEHYTTFVIQGMDLGFIVPAAVYSGIQMLRHKSAGYLLTSVILLKGATLCTALTAMIAGQAIRHVGLNPIEAVVFILLNIVVYVNVGLLMRYTKPSRS